MTAENKLPEQPAPTASDAEWREYDRKMSEFVERTSKQQLVVQLAEAAWGVLNHDNDFDDGAPHNEANWEALCKAIEKVLGRAPAVETTALEGKLAALVYYLQQVRGGYRHANALGVNSLLDDAEINEWIDRMNKAGSIPTRL